MPEALSPLEILDRLIAFPTVSRDTNVPLIDWVEDYLSGHGVESGRHWNEDRTKAGLYAHAGPAAEGGVVLSGHTDVVPVDGQPWTSDPFRLTERDGKYYGRGTCDMKGFDALAIWAVVEAKRQGVATPLQLALSYDEEVGCTGAPPLIESMLSAMPKARSVLVGEPSMMKAVTGHKGGMAFRVHIRGFEVHSSIMHTGVSAIMEGAKLIAWANETNAASRAATPGPVAALFDPPWTSVHVGQISGGTAHNITAADCRFGLDFRVVPGEDPKVWEKAFREKVAEIEAGMKAVRPEAGIDVTAAFALPPLKPEQDGPAETLARAITGDNGVHVVSYGTEASHFQARGYSAVVCGPGDIAQAHQPDEYITVEQFEAGHAFMRRLLDRLQGE